MWATRPPLQQHSIDVGESPSFKQHRMNVGESPTLLSPLWSQSRKEPSNGEQTLTPQS